MPPNRRIIPLLLLLVCCALAACAPDATTDRARPTADLSVYYAGPEGSVRVALGLAGFKLVDQPAAARVLVLNGTLPQVTEVARLVEAGAGLLLIGGPDVTPGALRALLGEPVELARLAEPISLSNAADGEEGLRSEVIWNSAPQIRERIRLAGIPLETLARSHEGDEVVLGRAQTGQGAVYILTPVLDERTNQQIQQWAYFNYLIYHLVERAAGQAPLTFADYPAAPVPHASDRVVMFVLLGGLLALTTLAFALVRRYSLAHPEALDVLVSNQALYQARTEHTDWDEIGFHRPLGGFMLALMLGLVLFVPLIIYQNLILPVYILPSAQALGMWGRVTQFFNVAWLFFDMGTSAAFIKFLAQERVDNPRQGILYGQLFVWWQALSGTVQVAMVVALASAVVPRSAYAIYAWSIVIHTLVQLPGFYQLARHALTGLQRFDYAQMLDVGLALIFPMLAQPVIVTLLYAWGRSRPAYGPAMGGLFGLGVAAYATELLGFLLGLALYRRLGLRARVLFMAHFDWQIIITSFRFGVFEMLGSIAWGFGQAAEIWITQDRLINYAEIWGNWGLAQNFVFAFQVLGTLFSNLMPSISEAISHGRQILSQYYAVQAYKYGGMISAFIGAVLLAVADRFILGASGPEFVRAAAYAIPLVAWGAIQYPSWVGDNVQLAANRPYLKTILIVGEQAVRVGLALILLERLQVSALIIAYFVGLLAKDLIAYVVNDRLCFRQRFYPWQSLVAPLIAGVAHYATIRWIGGLIWRGDQATSVLIFFLGILVSFPLFAFFYGLAGGWDDETLEELRRAAGLSSFMQPLAWLYWRASALGAQLSPLHGRFPITIRAQALLEAQALTGEKVSLV